MYDIFLSQEVHERTIHCSTPIRTSKLKYRSRRFYKILRLLPLKAVYNNITRTKWLWRSWMGFRLFWSSCSWLLIHKILLEVSWTLCLFYFTVCNTKLRNLDVKAVWKRTTLIERNCTKIKRFTQFLILNSTMMSVLRSPRFSAFGLEFTIALLNNCTFSHKRYIEIKRKLIRKIFEDKGQGGKGLGLQQREFISWRWELLKILKISVEWFPWDIDLDTIFTWSRYWLVFSFFWRPLQASFLLHTSLKMFSSILSFNHFGPRWKYIELSSYKGLSHQGEKKKEIQKTEKLIKFVQTNLIRILGRFFCLRLVLRLVLE